MDSKPPWSVEVVAKPLPLALAMVGMPTVVNEPEVGVLGAELSLMLLLLVLILDEGNEKDNGEEGF